MSGGMSFPQPTRSSVVARAKGTIERLEATNKRQAEMLELSLDKMKAILAISDIAHNENVEIWRDVREVISASREETEKIHEITDRYRARKA